MSFIYSFLLFSALTTSEKINIDDIRELSRSFNPKKDKEYILAYTLKSDPCVNVVYKSKKKRYCDLGGNHHLEHMYPMLYVVELDASSRSVRFKATTSRYDFLCTIKADKETMSCKGKK